MADKEEIKELTRKRGSFKGRLTIFSTYLSSLDKTLGQSEVCELQLRTNKMELLYSQYDEIQLKLECLADDIDVQLSERDDFERCYYKCISMAQNILSHNIQNTNDGSEKDSSRPTNQNV
ncbi:hypothetical protein ACJJTC_013526, partial [Scirpophaga incertulas]